jgi:hypothetical protein
MEAEDNKDDSDRPENSRDGPGVGLWEGWRVNNAKWRASVVKRYRTLVGGDGDEEEGGWTYYRAFHELREFIIHVLEPARMKNKITADKWLTWSTHKRPKGGACGVSGFGRSPGDQIKKNNFGEAEWRYFDLATAFRVSIVRTVRFGVRHVRSVLFVTTLRPKCRLRTPESTNCGVRGSSPFMHHEAHSSDLLNTEPFASDLKKHEL